MSKSLLAEAIELPIPERIQLVQDIWDSIAEVSNAAPLTQAQREEIDRRLEDYKAHPEDNIPWEQVRSEISGLNG